MNEWNQATSIAAAWQEKKVQNKAFQHVLILLCLTLLLVFWGALTMGTAFISTPEVFSILKAKLIGSAASSMQHSDIIWLLRLPRILLAGFAGAGLALCGMVMQAVVQNPLAEPYLLGVSAGASLGASCIILFSSNVLFLTIGTSSGAFLGAALAALLVLFLAGGKGAISTVKIVLAGTAANALFLSLTNFLIYMSDNLNGLRTLTFWTMGSLANASWETLILPVLGVSLGSIYFLLQARSLNTLLLGEETALTLGINLKKTRIKYLLFCALLTAIIVAACGTFGFIGLVIPHLVRLLVGSDHRRLTPAILLCGAMFLIGADLLARTLLPGGELPIGIITSLVGAPFFLYILYTRTVMFGSH